MPPPAGDYVVANAPLLDDAFIVAVATDVPKRCSR
jgi:hypothetical protein